MKLSPRRLLYALLLVWLFFSLAPRPGFSAAAEEYVYYAYVPAGSHPAGIGNYSYLDIVGLQDSTHVEVYNLTTRGLVNSTTVNQMELYTVLVPDESYVKVVADKRVVAAVSGGGVYNFGGNTFYPAATGGLIGKEFIFMAFPSEYRHAIFAYEDAQVTIYNSTGGQVYSTTLSAYNFEVLPYTVLAMRGLYRVESTGRITVSTWTGNAFTFVPSPRGGYVGRAFYASPVAWEGGVLMVFAYEDAHVKAVDPTVPSWAAALWPVLDADVKAGEYLFVRTGDKNLLIVSTGAISLLAGDTQGGNAPGQLGDDIAQAGLRANEEFNFYAPTTAVVFASRDVRATLDGQMAVFARGSYTLLTPGYHRLAAEGPLLVEVVGSDQGFDDWGTYLLCEQDLAAAFDLPPPPASLLSGSGMPLMLFLAPIIALPVVAVILVVLLLLRRRRRALGRGKPGPAPNRS